MGGRRRCSLGGGSRALPRDLAGAGPPRYRARTPPHRRRTRRRRAVRGAPAGNQRRGAGRVARPRPDGRAMMDEATARLRLPLIAPGQAQKEMTHNEALVLVDLLVQPAVEAVDAVSPPAAPAVGQAWAVGAGAGGDWSGQAGTVAGWTAGGWRFAGPVDGLAVWSRADAAPARWVGGNGSSPDRRRLFPIRSAVRWWTPRRGRRWRWCWQLCARAGLLADEPKCGAAATVARECSLAAQPRPG